MHVRSSVAEEKVRDVYKVSNSIQQVESKDIQLLQTTKKISFIHCHETVASEKEMW